jgi:hypothetical protein
MLVSEIVVKDAIQTQIECEHAPEEDLDHVGEHQDDEQLATDEPKLKSNPHAPPERQL